MENIATLLCSRDETLLVEHVTRLAHLAGIHLKVDRRVSDAQWLAEYEDASAGQAFAAGDAAALGAIPKREPPAWVEDYWPADALVLTSPQTQYSAPRRAVVVSLAGDGTGAGLVLPQDEEQVLNLLSSKRPQAQVIGVHGLVSGVNTTVIAALLSQAGFEAALNLEQWPQHQQNSGRGDLENRGGSDSRNTVCLVDFSGSTLPLGAYLAPVTGRNWDWRQLMHPGLPAPFRLAAGLPRWGEVAVLSGSGFIPPYKLSQVPAVFRALTQAFRLVVVDFGTGMNALDLAVDANIWVGNSTRQSVLAWEDLVLPSDMGHGGALRYLIQESAGSLPVNQVKRALELTHLDIPVFRFANHPKDLKLWNQEGIYWPPRKIVRREFAEIAHRVSQDLNLNPHQTVPLGIAPHETAATNPIDWRVEA